MKNRIPTVYSKKCGMEKCRNVAQYVISGEFIGSKKDIPLCQVHLLKHLRGESDKIAMIAEQAVSQLKW